VGEINADHIHASSAFIKCVVVAANNEKRVEKRVLRSEDHRYDGPCFSRRHSKIPETMHVIPDGLQRRQHDRYGSGRIRMRRSASAVLSS
jgi:hypothetical protein